MDEVITTMLHDFAKLAFLMGTILLGFVVLGVLNLLNSWLDDRKAATRRGQ